MRNEEQEAGHQNKEGDKSGVGTKTKTQTDFTSR